MPGQLHDNWLPGLPPHDRMDLSARRRDLNDQHLDVREKVRKSVRNRRRVVAADTVNRLVTEGWSSEQSRTLFRRKWRDDPELKAQVARDEVCRTCAYCAPRDPTWGLCLRPAGQHRPETLSLEFTCSRHVSHSWLSLSIDRRLR